VGKFQITNSEDEEQKRLTFCSSSNRSNWY
jgi:hypothetical protein